MVAGALANKPGSGGEAWVRLSWALGFQRLGYDVVFAEQIDRAACVDALGVATAFHASSNLAYFRSVTEQFGLSGSAALVCGDGDEVDGMSGPELLDVADAADLLLNISGNVRWPALLQRVRRKAYLDIDPGFTQFWHAAGYDTSGLADHDYHYTIAENIGSADCGIPTGGIGWRPTRQPVVLGEWPVCGGGDPNRLTTVSTWRSPFGPIEHGGRVFGLKHHEFRKVITLPRRVSQTCELALSIDAADASDLCQLREHGWRIRDPRRVAGDPDAFRAYVGSSGAEFSCTTRAQARRHTRGRRAQGESAPAM